MTGAAVELQMLGDIKGELGELRGQLREMIHTQNNHGQKIDNIFDHMSAIRSQADQVEGLKMRLGVVESDVTLLKRAKDREDGAKSLLERIVSSKAAGWLAMGLLALWAWATGKVHL